MLLQKPQHSLLRRPPAVRTSPLLWLCLNSTFEIWVWKLGLIPFGHSPLHVATANHVSLRLGTNATKANLTAQRRPWASVMLIKMLSVWFLCSTAGIWNLYSLYPVRTNWCPWILILSAICLSKQNTCDGFWHCSDENTARCTRAPRPILL